jgi:hypothetical protein
MLPFACFVYIERLAPEPRDRVRLGPIWGPPVPCGGRPEVVLGPLLQVSLQPRKKDFIFGSTNIGRNGGRTSQNQAKAPTSSK